MPAKNLLTFKSVELFPRQIKQAWDEVGKINFPVSFKKVKNIVVAGMGGSALGARIINSLQFEKLKIPLQIITGYHLPAYAGNETLVIASSYSGNTEETLSCFFEAKKKNCAIFIITTGGKLKKLAQKENIPGYLFFPKFNPSGQPRLGLGYSIMAQLALLAKCNFLDSKSIKIEKIINHLSQSEPEIGDLAKKILPAFKEKIIILVSAEHLNGAAHAIKNMFNENSKTFSARFSLPEMNHHLLEGLQFPKENQKILKFLFLESDFYEEKIKKRIIITKEILKKNKIGYEGIKFKSQTPLEEILEIIFWGEFASLYLASLNKVDPTAIPWVDYFKKKLS